MLKKQPFVAKRQRRKLSAELTAKVALAAIKEDRTPADICAAFKVHSTQISDWKSASSLSMQSRGVRGGAVLSVCPPLLLQEKISNSFCIVILI